MSVCVLIIFIGMLASGLAFGKVKWNVRHASSDLRSFAVFFAAAFKRWHYWIFDDDAKDVCCPYGLIFGGTDVNEYGTDPRYKDIMLQAVTNARFVILSCWDCSALALCYSAAEYCAPVWSRSAHTSQVDVQLNPTIRLISSTLRSTPLPWLQVLSNIEPPAVQRNAATDKLVEKIVKHDSWPIQLDILISMTDVQEAAVLATSWHQKSMEA